MAKVDLSKYGITGTTEVVYNPSYEQLFEEETKPSLEGYEVGKVSELGAVDVMTGIYTGRSPKDKFIVMDENSKNTVWWTSDEYKNDNHPASQEAWEAVKEIAKKELSNKRLYVVDAFCGANKDTRMAVRFIMEVAWQAHFVTNMFIKPTAEERENFEPDFVVYNASKAYRLMCQLARCDVVGAVIPNHRNITSRCLIQERIASEKKNVDFANDPVIKKQSLSMRKGKQRLRKVYVQTAFPVPKYARQWQ